MRKKHHMVMPLALAGALALTGTGVLSLKISDIRAEKIVVREKKNAVLNGQTDESPKTEEKTAAREASGNGLEIELPADAEMKEEKEDSLTFLWDGLCITYYAPESGKKIEADMLTVEDAVKTAVQSVREYTKENNIGENIWISLKKKNEGIWYFAIDVEGTKNHSYTLLINSITGQTFGYADYYDKNASAAEYTGAELERVKPEYTEIAGDFIKESLNFEQGVREYYAFTAGFMETENGTRNTFDIFCRTESGDIVMITMDQLEKKVLAFEINPLQGF